MSGRFRSLVRTKLALSKTGRFLSKAEILGVLGVFLPPFNWVYPTLILKSEGQDWGVGSIVVGSSFLWETDFYTPPVLGGAALLPFSAPAVYKNPVPQGP